MSHRLGTGRKRIPRCFWERKFLHRRKPGLCDLIDPLCASPAPVGGGGPCDTLDYLYCPHSKLASSYGVIAIRGCHSGGGDAPKSVRIARRISRQQFFLLQGVPKSALVRYRFRMERARDDVPVLPVYFCVHLLQHHPNRRCPAAGQAGRNAPGRVRMNIFLSCSDMEIDPFPL